MLTNTNETAGQTQAVRSGTQVIALHCSGGNPSNWKPLEERVAKSTHFVTPSYYGYGHKRDWQGQEDFTLASEAADIIQALDSFPGQTHLVGHCYGGAVALHIASVRPEKIASLSLYEPCAFHLLKDTGCAGRLALDQISVLREGVASDIAKGDYQSAMRDFVDYWNGRGSWDSMHTGQQAKLLESATKIPLEFNAAFAEPTTLPACHGIVAPIQIVYGKHAPLPTMFIAKYLAVHLSGGHSIKLQGAGHMGPLTHLSTFADLVARQILSTQRFKRQSREESRIAA